MLYICIIAADGCTDDDFDRNGNWVALASETRRNVYFCGQSCKRQSAPEMPNIFLHRADVFQRLLRTDIVCKLMTKKKGTCYFC